jgi:hypothetical protein
MASRRILRVLRVLALGLLLLGLGADALGVGQPGFGERQWLMVIAGALLLGATYLGRTRASAATDSPSTSFERFRAGYSTLALIAFNTALVFVLLNLLAALGLRLAAPPDTGITSPLLRIPLVRLAHLAGGRASQAGVATLALSDAQLARIYPGWSRQQVADLLAETRGRSLRLHPYTQFEESPHRGRYVNVVEPGQRLIRDPGPWPMAATGVHNVWVFGGSTTFGYGLPDAETIPSRLQEGLRRRYPGAAIQVYNFGQGYFFSSQELALFQSLLAAGSAPPEVALFVDGINEHQREPFYTGYLQRLTRSPWTAFVIRDDSPSIGDGDAVVARWLRNKRMAEGICAAFRIKPLFVWQPAPDWKYDLRQHPLWWEKGEKPPPGSDPVYGASPHYAALDRLRAASPAALGTDFLWLGDLQVGERRPLYVDRIHYTAAFAREIAERVAERIQQGL